MYILYLDESGAHSKASYFVLAGLAVFEREIHWFARDLNLLQDQYFPNETEPVFFHASRLHTRRNDRVDPPWHGLSDDQKKEIKARLSSVIRSRQGILFGCAIEKAYAEQLGESPYERAFEEVVRRFDLFMTRSNHEATTEHKEEQRGLLVLAHSTDPSQRTIPLLARRLQERGTRWGQLRSITDVLYFAPAKDTRMLQYADFCANAIYGKYESGLAKDFDAIAHKFDHDGNVLHGLVHLTIDQPCGCVACFSRRGQQQPLIP